MIPTAFRFLNQHKHVISGIAVGSVCFQSSFLNLSLMNDHERISDFFPLIVNTSVGFYFGKKSLQQFTDTFQTHRQFIDERIAYRTTGNPALWPSKAQNRFILACAKHGTFFGGSVGAILHLFFSIFLFFGIAFSGIPKKPLLFRENNIGGFFFFLIAGMCLGAIGGGGLAMIRSSRLLWN